MNNKDNPFQPESIDEQVRQLTQSAPHPASFAQAEERLIQDLHQTYKEYVQSGEHVWQRLSAHLEEQKSVSSPKILFLTKKRITSERSPSMQIPDLNTMESRSSTPARRPRRFLTLVAAVLIAAVLVGSAAFVFTTLRQPGPKTTGTAGQPASTPHPTLTPTPEAKLPYPCPHVNRPFLELCQQNKVQVIDQTKTVQADQKLTIVAGYADSSHILLWSHINWDPVGMGFLERLTSLQLAQMQNGLDADSGNTVDGMTTGFDTISVYTLHNTPTGLHQLNVRLDATFIENSTHMSVSFNFSLPFHTFQTAFQPVSVTANGITITLQEVDVTPAGTTIDLMSPRLTAGAWLFITLLAGKQHCIIDGARTLNVQGKNSPITGVELTVQQDLTHESGTWTLTILPKAISGATVPWVFTLTI